MTWNRPLFDRSHYWHQEEAGHDCSPLDFESSQNPELLAVSVLFLPATPTASAAGTTLQPTVTA